MLRNPTAFSRMHFKRLSLEVSSKNKQKFIRNRLNERGIDKYIEMPRCDKDHFLQKRNLQDVLQGLDRQCIILAHNLQESCTCFIFLNDSCKNRVAVCETNQEIKLRKEFD